jgi:DNA-binding CsgD family transcriptional regulator
MEQAWVTRREREVMRLVAGGRTTAEIARRLGITANTVESHVRSVRTKLGVPTRTAAVAWLPAAADASRPPHRARARLGAPAHDRAPAGSVGRRRPAVGSGGGVAADGGLALDVTVLGLVGSALLAALARGLPVTAAAREGHMSLRTAHRRLSDARHALGAATTAEAVARWCAAGGAVAGRPDGSHPWRVGA